MVGIFLQSPLPGTMDSRAVILDPLANPTILATNPLSATTGTNPVSATPIKLAKEERNNHDSNAQLSTVGDQPVADRTQPNDLAGKRILLVSVGQDVTKLGVYRHLRTLGVRLAVLESPNNEFAALLTDKGVCEKFIPVDLSTRPSLVNDCIKQIDACGILFDGILTYWDDAVGLSARLCEHYRFPGGRVNAVDVAHDKRMTRVALANAGFASPRSTTINYEGELLEKSSVFSFPVILKPLYGAASIGVVKVEDQKDLIAKYRGVAKILEHELSSGGLMGLTFEAQQGSNTRTFCMEEFIDGVEYDCDIIMFRGEVVYAKAVDNLPLQQPNFCEIMELTPPWRGPEVAKSIETYSGQILQVFGFTDGVFHVEIIDDHRLGPVLVECNPRMGGGPMRGIHLDVYGVDLAEEALRVALNISPRLEKKRKAGLKQCVTVNLHAMVSGVLESDAEDALSFLNDDVHAIQWVCPNRKGERLTGWFDGYPSKMGRIHLTYEDGISGQEAIERANECLNRFNHNVVSIMQTDDPKAQAPTDFFTARSNHFLS